MATSTQNSDDLFRQAICAWESAVASGVKMQEESAKALREMFSNSSSLSEWYNKGQAVAGETIVKTQGVAFDASGFEPKLRGFDGRDIAAGTGADDD